MQVNLFLMRPLDRLTGEGLAGAVQYLLCVAGKGGDGGAALLGSRLSGHTSQGSSVSTGTNMLLSVQSSSDKKRRMFLIFQ
jgi:sugar (pentulose or hexulose) kinase